MIVKSKQNYDYIKRIQYIRLINDWTQEVMAKQLGVSFRTIQNWEQGVCEISGPARKIIDMMMVEYDDELQ